MNKGKSNRFKARYFRQNGMKYLRVCYLLYGYSKKKKQNKTNDTQMEAGSVFGNNCGNNGDNNNNSDNNNSGDGNTNADVINNNFNAPKQAQQQHRSYIGFGIQPPQSSMLFFLFYKKNISCTERYNTHTQALKRKANGVEKRFVTYLIGVCV